MNAKNKSKGNPTHNSAIRSDENGAENQNEGLMAAIQESIDITFGADSDDQAEGDMPEEQNEEY